MNKEMRKVYKHMMDELNFYVEQYEISDRKNDAEGKVEWEQDFKQHVKAYNNLLSQMFPKVNYLRFSRRIEKYKEDREWRYE